MKKVSSNLEESRHVPLRLCIDLLQCQKYCFHHHSSGIVHAHVNVFSSSLGESQGMRKVASTLVESRHVMLGLWIGLPCRKYCFHHHLVGLGSTFCCFPALWIRK